MFAFKLNRKPASVCGEHTVGIIGIHRPLLVRLTIVPIVPLKQTVAIVRELSAGSRQRSEEESRVQVKND